jgi:hypothetical protein
MSSGVPPASPSAYFIMLLISEFGKIDVRN